MLAEDLPLICPHTTACDMGRADVQREPVCAVLETVC